MKKNQKAMVAWLVIIAILAAGFFLLKSTDGAAQKVDLAKCLTESGAKFYGTFWCPHCANQKAMFEEGVKYLPYIECADPANPNTPNPVCTQANITSYPTWVFADGTRKSGEVPLDILAETSGCTY